MRLAVLAFASLLALAPPAFASGAPAKTGDDSNLVVEMPMLVAPVTVNGHLYHYAYMRVMFQAADVESAHKARDKVPFILDAMLRDTHRQSIALNGDPQIIDGEGLKQRLMKVATSVVGEGALTSISFRDTIQTDDPEANQAAEAAAAEHAAAEPAAAEKPAEH
ncbi:MAG: hypothetical protein IT548_11120 [Alphaproteobacteria bacterium]|nr:hypothetical protein [Alphaproteobacteria bacterium]